MTDKVEDYLDDWGSTSKSSTSNPDIADFPDSDSDRSNWNNSDVYPLDDHRREFDLDLDHGHDPGHDHDDGEGTFGDSTASVPSCWTVSSGASWMAETEIDQLLKSHQVTTCMEIENKLKLVKLNDERFKAEAKKITPVEFALSTDRILKTLFRKFETGELKIARLVCRRWNLLATPEMMKRVRINFPQYTPEIEPQPPIGNL